MTPNQEDGEYVWDTFLKGGSIRTDSYFVLFVAGGRRRKRDDVLGHFLLFLSSSMCLF